MNRIKRRAFCFWEVCPVSSSWSTYRYCSAIIINFTKFNEYDFGTIITTDNPFFYQGNAGSRSWSRDYYRSVS